MLSIAIIIVSSFLAIIPAAQSFRDKKWLEFGCIVFLGLVLIILLVKKDSDDGNISDAKDARIEELKDTLNSANKNISILKNDLTSTQTLSELNIGLTRQLDTLSRLNNFVATNTQTLAKDGKTLITRNLATTNNLNSLTQNAKFLLDKIYDEQTTGNSIPLVSAITFADEIPPSGSPMDKENQVYGISSSGKYLLYVDLENTGNYKLTDITLTTRTIEVGNKRIPPFVELYTGNLLPKDSKRLYEEVLCTLTPEVDSLGEPNHYYPPAIDQYITIAVHWRTIKYSYTYELLGSGTRTLFIKGYYFYNGKTLDKQGLLNAILKDKEDEKKLFKDKKG